jgi:putative acetyltransferase
MLQPTDHFAEVEPLREASRLLVRELGLLDDRGRPSRISLPQCHALIELDRAGGDGLGVAELAARLNVDKSTMSRTANRLVRDGLITAGEGPDRRHKPLRLAAAGKKKLAALNTAAGDQVHAALALLDGAARRTVLDGLSLYAGALARLRARRSIAVRPVSPCAPSSAATTPRSPPRCAG